MSDNLKLIVHQLPITHFMIFIMLKPGTSSMLPDVDVKGVSAKQSFITVAIGYSLVPRRGDEARLGTEDVKREYRIQGIAPVLFWPH